MQFIPPKREIDCLVGARHWLHTLRGLRTTEEATRERNKLIRPKTFIDEWNKHRTGTTNTGTRSHKQDVWMERSAVNAQNAFDSEASV